MHDISGAVTMLFPYTPSWPLLPALPHFPYMMPELSRASSIVAITARVSSISRRLYTNSRPARSRSGSRLNISVSSRRNRIYIKQPKTPHKFTYRLPLEPLYNKTIPFQRKRHPRITESLQNKHHDVIMGVIDWIISKEYLQI